MSARQDIDSTERTPVDHGAALLTGAAAAAGLIGIWACFYGAGIAPFPPFDLADRIIAYSPGELSTSAIENTGSLAQRLLLAGGIVFWVAAGLALGTALRTSPTGRRGLIYSLVALPIVLWTSYPSDASLSFIDWLWRVLFFSTTLMLAGGLTGHWLALISADSQPAKHSSGDNWLDQPGDPGRRDVLRQALGVTLFIGVGGVMTGWLLDWFGVNDEPTLAGIPLDEVRATLNQRAEKYGTTLNLSVPASLPPMVDAFPAPVGIRPRNTPNNLFYTVDISTRDPNLPEDRWTLRVHGEVEHELLITYEDLLSMPAIELDGTLMCISYEYDSRLISTTRWTGVRLRDVLAMAGVNDSAVDLINRGAGGYSDSIELSKALEPTTLLAYAMNGVSLQKDHGFPCRLYVPDRYGIKNVKWLREIEVSAVDYRGFWQERGWSESGVINVISIIDTPRGQTSLDDQRSVEIGGIAFAGNRGISKVEIQIDYQPWQSVNLEEYNPALVWQRWQHNWQPAPGTHQIQVRATDMSGMLQDATRRDPHPDGLTGYQTVEVEILATG